MTGMRTLGPVVIALLLATNVLAEECSRSAGRVLDFEVTVVPTAYANTEDVGLNLHVKHSSQVWVAVAHSSCFAGSSISILHNMYFPSDSLSVIDLSKELYDPAHDFLLLYTRTTPDSLEPFAIITLREGAAETVRFPAASARQSRLHFLPPRPPSG